ncbi:hypothetical protein YC2023_120038 [Brassica napus]
MAFENNHNNTKLTKLSHISQNLSLSTLWKSIAISGALLFLLHTFAFNHPHKMITHKLFAPLEFTFSSSEISTSASLQASREPPTNISHLLFVIVGSTKTWRFRRGYIEPWWRPNITRGHVFLEKPPGRDLLPWPQQSPPFIVNKDSSITNAKFKTQIRLFQSLHESFNKASKDTRWYLGVYSDLLSFRCLADLGIDLTMNKGIHQVGCSIRISIDLHGDISGLLSAHPQSPLISLHHFDVINPIFPAMSRQESVNHLMKTAKIDQSRILQQTICYQRGNNWSVSVSWGYSVHVYQSVLPRNYLKRPLETFRPWKNVRIPVYTFNTRRVTNDPCEMPRQFFFESVVEDKNQSLVTTMYKVKTLGSLPPCLPNTVRMSIQNPPLPNEESKRFKNPNACLLCAL